MVNTQVCSSINDDHIDLIDVNSGPLIEANWGDQIQVKLTNKSPEGTAIHWHGILQKDNQAFDGVPGVSQCPIAPGKSFTYSWTAELYGTSW